MQSFTHRIANLPKTSKHSASGPLAGYLFQCRLALLRGLQMAKKKPNGHISIEKFDDIAFEDEDYSKCLIQAKHSVNAKSLSDTSVDLWKTLKIWIDQLDQGIIIFGSTKFALITTCEAKEGSAASLLRTGASDKDLEQSLALLRSAAFGSKNELTKDARTALLALSHEKAMTFLRQIEVIDNHANLIDVMDEIEGEVMITAPSHVGEVASYLEGWWLRVVGKCLVEDSSASIPVQHILIKASEIGKSFGPDALPIDEPDSLGAKDYTDDDEAELFVRQMRVIGMSDRIVRRGAQDYYRAFAQRSKWARENLILDSDLGKYDADLADRWGRKFDAECAESSPDTEPKKQICGRNICLWASQESIPFRSVVETWITAGSFQGLSDRLKIGWHPDFETLFAEEVADDAP